MGVNLFIDTPGWDAFANGGMKTIFFDHDRFPKVWRDTGLDDADFRPKDFSAWRFAIRRLNCNVDMWLRGLDALERDPEVWVRASY